MDQALALAAYNAAKENYHGDTEASIGNLQPIAQLFADEPGITLCTLDGNWSGAFVYYCTELAGFGLPIRYADSRVTSSFAEVRAWEQYARLPKIGLWLHAGELPEPGDIVIFETPADKPPLMGIVTGLEGEMMEVAVGNYRNHSALIERPIGENVRGWIRLKST